MIFTRLGDVAEPRPQVLGTAPNWTKRRFAFPWPGGTISAAHTAGLCVVLDRTGIRSPTRDGVGTTRRAVLTGPAT
jgi:hypothetical protein